MVQKKTKTKTKKNYFMSVKLCYLSNFSEIQLSKREQMMCLCDKAPLDATEKRFFAVMCGHNTGSSPELGAFLCLNDSSVNVK